MKQTFQYSSEQWSRLLCELESGTRGSVRVELSTQRVSYVRHTLQETTQWCLDLRSAGVLGKFDYKHHAEIISELQKQLDKLRATWAQNKSFLDGIIRPETDFDDLFVDLEKAPPPVDEITIPDFLSRTSALLSRLKDSIQRDVYRDVPRVADGVIASMDWHDVALTTILRRAMWAWWFCVGRVPWPQIDSAGEPQGPYSRFCAEVASHVKHNLQWSGIRSRLESLRPKMGFPKQPPA